MVKDYNIDKVFEKMVDDGERNKRQSLTSALLFEILESDREFSGIIKDRCYNRYMTVYRTHQSDEGLTNFHCWFKYQLGKHISL